MRSRLWLVLLVFALLVPRPALAEDVKRIEPDSKEDIELVGNLRAAPVTPFTMIQMFFVNVRFSMNGTNRLYKLYNAVIKLLTTSEYQVLFIIPAVAMVFGWWGVRKVIRMLFRAFRRGKANV